MQKIINGNMIEEIFEVQEPETFLEEFGFRFFESYLKQIDPWTQDYFNINMGHFKAAFLKFSIDNKLSDSEKFGETSYKHFGVMSIWDLKKILTLTNDFYKNTHNYILKLRAAVGMNLDYFTPDDTVTI